MIKELNKMMYIFRYFLYFIILSYTHSIHDTQVLFSIPSESVFLHFIFFSHDFFTHKRNKQRCDAWFLLLFHFKLLGARNNNDNDDDGSSV